METNQPEKRKIQTFIRTEPEIDMDKVEKAKDKRKVKIEKVNNKKCYDIFDFIAGM